MLKGKIRRIPRCIHTEALEAFALNIDIFFSPLATQTAQRYLIDLRHFFFAKRLLNHVLDRLTMAVPSRHIWREIPLLSMAFNHEVFQNFVECMANMNRPIRIRRPVM